MLKNIFMIVFATFGLISLMGCNHFLYYPTRAKYVDAKKLKFPPEQIEVKSSSGQKLVGWYFKATDSAAGESLRPTILFFHGNGQNLSAHFMSLYWVLEQGYDYLIFDYPGYGGSEGEPTQTNTVESGQVFYQWLKENTGNPVVIYGQSLGGAVALQVAQAVSEDDQLCLVVADSTFASYKSVARSTLAKNWFTWPIQWLGYLLISDTEAPKSNISKIAPKPLVVIHGRKDQIVAYDMGEAVFKEAKEPKELWTVEDGRHIESFYNRNQGGELRKKFIQKMKHFCSQSQVKKH